MAAANKKIVSAIKRYRTARLARLVPHSYLLYRKGRKQEMYDAICEEFVNLGGVYLKFMQGVLLRSKLMKHWQNPDKLKIFENLDTEPMDIIDVLRKELPRHKLAQISSVQPVPFAAGTFGQVYYGTHVDGRPIIIKVLRPLIRETLKYDLRLLNTFMQRFYIRFNSKNMDTDSREALRDFAEATMRETDYKAEVKFAQEMRDAYKDSSTVFIPETFAELCTDNIIVQEYVHGISLAELVKLKQQGVDISGYVKDELGTNLEKQIENLGYELLWGAFSLPRVQGDPHPGNIRLMKDGRVGFIDFGISARAPEDKAAFLSIIEAYDGMMKGSKTITDLFETSLRFFVRDLYRSLMTISSYIGEKAEKALPIQIGQVAERVFEQATGKNGIDMKNADDDTMIIEANKVFNSGNRFGLILKFEETAMMRSAQSFTSLMVALGLYKKVMPRVTERVIKQVEKTYGSELHTSEPVSLSDAIDVVTSWLERIADKDPKLFNEISRKIRMNIDTIKEGEVHA